MNLKKFATKKNASKAVAMVLSSGLNYGTVNMTLADEATDFVPVAEQAGALVSATQEMPLYALD